MSSQTHTGSGLLAAIIETSRSRAGSASALRTPASCTAAAWSSIAAVPGEQHPARSVNGSRVRVAVVTVSTLPYILTSVDMCATVVASTTIDTTWRVFHDEAGTACTGARSVRPRGIGGERPHRCWRRWLLRWRLRRDGPGRVGRRAVRVGLV